ncbi:MULTISPECIES: DoxX family protein [Haloferax]|uniref:DoxX family membrane protein n=2 Tax=Haloferax TaxID=2251 RepID=A0A6G1Z2F6_9EURY|nr:MULTISPECIES: DoxX family membrane protein [Haloferax]KAB1188054.1 DoxX family membrane protein [Haloferax sp. CBA1149]MRW80726.1 DoxX family membrane protein [Haloferax marinisediminis]
MSSTVRRAAILSGLVALLTVATGTVSAHVKYVTPGSDPIEVLAFLVTALSNPFNLAVLGVGGLGVTIAGAAYLKLRPFPNDVRVFRRTLKSYEDLLPWLLRLAVGLPLVGAGFSGYFFSPVVEPASPVFVRLFGITVGFLLLFGFGTRLVAAFGLLSYLVGLAVEPALLLAFEYVPGFLAIALVGGGKPSADDVVASMAADDRTVYSRFDPFYRRVALPFVERTNHLEAYVPTILRLGLGITFIYLGVAQKLMEPGDALAVVAKYDLTAVVPVAPELWVVGAGLTELLVGLLLLAGAFTRAASSVSFLLFTTTLFGLPDDPVLAHISLFGLVSALLVTGGGPFSVDEALHTRSQSDTPTTEPPRSAKGD